MTFSFVVGVTNYRCSEELRLRSVTNGFDVVTIRPEHNHDRAVVIPLIVRSNPRRAVAFAGCYESGAVHVFSLLTRIGVERNVQHHVDRGAEAAFGALMAPAKELQRRYLSQIQEKARSVKMGDVMAMVRRLPRFAVCVTAAVRTSGSGRSELRCRFGCLALSAARESHSSQRWRAWQRRIARIASRR